LLWPVRLPVILDGWVGGLIATIAGLINLIPGPPHQGACRIGITHMVLNLVLVVLFAWNGYNRWTADVPPEPGAPWLGFWLSLIGVVILVVSGWLGGEMVFKYHVGVVEHPETKDEAATRQGGAGQRAVSCRVATVPDPGYRLRCPGLVEKQQRSFASDVPRARCAASPVAAIIVGGDAEADAGRTRVVHDIAVVVHQRTIPGVV